MNATAAECVVGIDVAKSVFQLAVADGAWRVIEQHRLTRSQMHAGSKIVWSIWSSWKRAVRRTMGALAQLARHRGEAPTSAVCARIREKEQDRFGRCPCARGGRALRRDRPGEGEIDRAAGASGPAPHALPMDGYAQLAHQRAARKIGKLNTSFH
jgi:hypothetical protein